MVDGLSHENLVNILGKFTIDPGKKKGLVMELCQGTLADLMESGRDFDIGEMSYLSLQLFQGLDYLHSKSITHRYKKIYCLATHGHWASNGFFEGSSGKGNGK